MLLCTHLANAQEGSPGFVAERGGGAARVHKGTGADADDVADTDGAGEVASEWGRGASAERRKSEETVDGIANIVAFGVHAIAACKQ